MKRVFCCLLLLIVLPVTAPAGQTILWFRSAPEDYIGQGREYSFTQGVDADISVNRIAGGYSFYVNNSDHAPWTDGSWWYLMIEARKGQTLKVGSQENAVRSPLNDSTHAGISLFGDSRSCGELTGRFRVIEIERDVAGNLLKFAADFEQRCETGAPLTGAIRYKSDLPITKPLTTTIEIGNPLNADNCMEATGPDGAMVTLNGSATNSGTFSWITTTGLTASGPVFTMPVALNNPTGVTLTFTDVNGNSSTASKSICVSDTTPPLIRIIAPENGETISGDNVQLEVEITDFVDRDVKRYNVTFGASFSGELIEGVGRMKLSKPQKGDTAETEITVTARDASGNSAKQGVAVFERRDNIM